MNILVRKNNRERGPYTAAELRERLKSGVFSGSDLGQVEGESEWKPLAEILLGSLLATEESTEARVTTPAGITTYSWLRQPKIIGGAIVLLLLIFGGINWLNKASEKRRTAAAAARQTAAMEQARKQTEEMIRRTQEQAAKMRQAQFQSVQNTQQQYDQAARDYVEKQKQEQAKRDEVERQKAEVQKRLQDQMAQKQEESRRQAQEEQKGKVAQGQQKAQEVTKKHQEIVAKIIRTKAKIEEQEVAPIGTAVKYAVSPHALHIAAATLKGSRPFMVVDGVSGPAFDELIWVQGRKFEAVDKLVHHGDPQRLAADMDSQRAPVVFSEDGTRFAYVGRQGDRYVLMVDGKEVGRGAYIPDTDSAAVTSLSFVPGSNRLCYIRRFPRPANESDSSNFRGVQLAVEGDKNPPMETVPDAPISFSRDGQHYAYFINFASDDTTYYEKYRHLVVDGKLDPPEFTVPGFTSTSGVALFTGDSKHLITTRSKRIPHQGQTSGFTERPVTIFFDKNPVLEAPHVEVLRDDARTNKKVARPYYAVLEELSVAPVGTNYIAVFGIGTPQVSTPSHYRVFFNGRQVADVPKVETIVWSPDGKRYMVKCETKNNSQFMLIDGKKEPEYRSVTFHSNRESGGYSKTNGFTADSSNSVYLAQTDKQFLIVEGAESDGYKAIDDLIFTDKGGHFGFVATDDGGSRIPVIDGSAAEPRKDVRDLVLASDATHFGFVSGNRDFPLPVIDGVEQPFLLADDLIHYSFSSGIIDRHFLFSPEGKHFAFCALSGAAPNSKSDESLKHSRGFCLDGQFLACENCGLGTYGRCEMRPFFTPDNTHIVWLAWDADSRGVAGCSVFVDGQQEAHFDCPSIVHRVEGTEQNVGYFFAHAENAAEMGADGVLTFFVPVEKAVKRIRVIPPSDTDLGRFAAMAQEQQMGAQDQTEQQSTRSNY
jgi:hypothetical protein